MAHENCAHSGCKCKVDQGKGVSKDGKTYCCDHCSRAGATPNPGKCQCGHPECRN